MLKSKLSFRRFLSKTKQQKQFNLLYRLKCFIHFKNQVVFSFLSDAAAAECCRFVCMYVCRYYGKSINKCCFVIVFLSSSFGVFLFLLFCGGRDINNVVLLLSLLFLLAVLLDLYYSFSINICEWQYNKF